jgi:hypothetical protein
MKSDRTSQGTLGSEAARKWEIISHFRWSAMNLDKRKSVHAEWISLTESGSRVSAQLAPKGPIGRPESGSGVLRQLAAKLFGRRPEGGNREPRLVGCGQSGMPLDPTHPWRQA